MDLLVENSNDSTCLAPNGSTTETDALLMMNCHDDVGALPVVTVDGAHDSNQNGVDSLENGLNWSKESDTETLNNQLKQLQAEVDKSTDLDLRRELRKTIRELKAFLQDRPQSASKPGKNLTLATTPNTATKYSKCDLHMLTPGSTTSSKTSTPGTRPLSCINLTNKTNIDTTPTTLHTEPTKLSATDTDRKEDGNNNNSLQTSLKNKSGVPTTLTSLSHATKAERSRAYATRPDFVKTLPAYVCVDEREALVLQCKVVASPAPIISWYKDDELLPNDEKYRQSCEELGGEMVVALRIDEVTLAEKAVFACSAVNKGGEARITSKVRVIPKGIGITPTIGSDGSENYVETADIQLTVDNSKQLEEEVTKRIEGIDDEETLTKMLDNSDVYEERKIIRARIREVRAKKGPKEAPKPTGAKNAAATFKKLEVNTGLSAEAGSKQATSPSVRDKAQNTAKASLQKWCQIQTRGYEHVDIQNFSSSWNDGMAFCALVHSICPDAFNFKDLDPQNRRQNFQLAFDTAEKFGDVMPLLEVDDMVKMQNPDWKSVFTYIHMIYAWYSEK